MDGDISTGMAILIFLVSLVIGFAAMVLPLWLSATLVCFSQSSFGKAIMATLLIILLSFGTAVIGAIVLAISLLVLGSGLIALVLMALLIIATFYFLLRILASVYDISLPRAFGVWAVEVVIVIGLQVGAFFIAGPDRFFDEETGLSFSDYMELMRGGEGDLRDMKAWEIIQGSLEAEAEPPVPGPRSMAEVQEMYHLLLQTRDELDSSDPEAVAAYNRQVEEYEAALKAARAAEPSP